MATKVLVQSFNWRLQETPFKALTCELIFGEKADKHASCMLVYAPYLLLQQELLILIEGTIPGVEWKQRKMFHEAALDEAVAFSRQLRADDKTQVNLRLPEPGFEVVKTSKGTVVIRNSTDTTTASDDRVLVLIGHGAERAKFEIFEPETDATIVAQAVASNEGHGAIEVAALVKVGQKITFRERSEPYGRDVLHTFTLSDAGHSSMAEDEVHTAVWPAKKDLVDDLACEVVVM